MTNQPDFGRFNKAFGSWWNQVVRQDLEDQADADRNYQKLLDMAKFHADTFKLLKVTEISPYGSYRQCQGKPFWTWNEMGYMALNYGEEAKTDHNFFGLLAAIEDLCASRHRIFEPPMDVMLACTIRIPIK